MHIIIIYFEKSYSKEISFFNSLDNRVSYTYT